MTAAPNHTKLPLIILALVVGLGLGWLLHDLLMQPAVQVLAPTPVVSPTLAPQPAASVTSQATVSLIPAPTPTSTSVAQPISTPTSDVQAVEPTTAVDPDLEPTPTGGPEIVAYTGYVVAENETLAEIAANGGSAPDLISSYNLLDGTPQPGRPLIIPQLAGQTSILENAPILIQQGYTDKPWVALTLDAGAGSEPVPQILATLKERQVHLTFFLTGAWMEANPELTRQIAADGHEIANHTFNHPDLTKLSDIAIRTELADTESLTQAIAGVTTRPFFRPPYGSYDQRVLLIAQEQGYLPIYWTFDSLDSIGEPKTPEFLVERITGKLPPEQLPGAIILAHCGSQPTADALPAILDRFAELGIEVKKLSEVLGS